MNGVSGGAARGGGGRFPKKKNSGLVDARSLDVLGQAANASESQACSVAPRGSIGGGTSVKGPLSGVATATLSARDSQSDEEEDRVGTSANKQGDLQTSRLNAPLERGILGSKNSATAGASLWNTEGYPQQQSQPQPQPQPQASQTKLATHSYQRNAQSTGSLNTAGRHPPSAGFSLGAQARSNVGSFNRALSREHLGATKRPMTAPMKKKLTSPNMESLKQENNMLKLQVERMRSHSKRFVGENVS